MKNKAAYYIKTLGLTKHIEGGAFRETYRSELIIPQQILPPAFHGNRNALTLIYFLLEYGECSAFHKIGSDEAWHFYDGDALTIYEIQTDGKLHTHQLGKNLAAGETFQYVVKAGTWFGSRCEVENGFSLVGCSVSPGFDFADFELGRQKELSQDFPQLAALIAEFTN